MSLLWKNRWLSLLTIFIVWLSVRVLFFEGYWGFDDISHVVYAMAPDVPIQVFEARYLYNLLLVISFRVFGVSEWSAAIPTLLASWTMVVTVWWAGRRFFGHFHGFLGALVVALVSLDVTQSTVPMATSQAAALAGLGTVFVLTDRSRTNWLIAGALFGLSISTHLAAAFYFGPVLVTMFFASLSRKRTTDCILMLIACVAAFGLTEVIFGTALAGSWKHRFHVIASTHSNTMVKEIGPTLDDGRFNPEWIFWSARSLVVTRELGLAVLLAIGGGLFCWRQMERIGRTLWVLVAFGWLYVNFGTQSPFSYAPLDHQVRYWYPILVPLCLLIMAVLRALADRQRLRLAFTAALFLPLPLMLSLAGPWGQGAELSRVLLQHADSNPDATFVTDLYTFEDVFALSAGQPPANVFVFDEGESLHCETPRLPEPVFSFSYLVNPSNLNRNSTRRYTKIVATLKVHPVSEPVYRPLAYCLPDSITHRRHWWYRRPSALVGTINFDAGTVTSTTTKQRRPDGYVNASSN